MRKATAIALALTGLALCGCSGERGAPPAAKDANRHSVRGTVRGVAEDRASLVVDHEEIPGLMPAMTMPFPLASAQLARGVETGDLVEMQLETGAEWSVVSLRVLRRAAAATADARAAVQAPPRPARAGERYFQVGVGQRVPDFTLIDHRGRPMALSSLRGKAVVLSFIYTRCPMPKLCPLVTRNLRELQHNLSPEQRARTHLLAVTMDPAYDTPEILERYGRQFGLDLDHASLLTGPVRDVALLGSFFGNEFYNEQDGTITHKTRLVVIDPRGRLHAEVWGPNWTLERALGLLRQALAEDGRAAGGAAAGGA
jgi:protein SCO1